jgi:hypothetical protein
MRRIFLMSVRLGIEGLIEKVERETVVAKTV